MSEIIWAIFVSIASNMDNLFICMSYAKKLSLKENLIVSTITVLLTAMALLLGSIISGILTQYLATVISCASLIIIGIYTLINGFIQNNQENVKNNLYLLAFVLSLNNLPTAMICTIKGYNMLLFIFSFFVFSFIFIYLSNLLCNKINSKYTSIIAAILLILSALIRIFRINKEISFLLISVYYIFYYFRCNYKSCYRWHVRYRP